MKLMPSKTVGFSITEVAIVLIVIGIIIAGIIAGAHLNHQSELRSLISEYRQYKSAITAFETQYGALPGDMIDASVYWPGASNGNGNGSWVKAEGYRAWLHLSLSELITETFSGMNLPASRRGNNRWFPFTHTKQMYSIPGNTRNSLNLVASCCWQYGISPEDAQTIDHKIDDGRAISGDVLGFSSGNATNCVKDNEGTGNPVDQTYTGVDADYDTFSDDANSDICAISFLL